MCLWGTYDGERAKHFLKAFCGRSALIRSRFLWRPRGRVEFTFRNRSVHLYVSGSTGIQVFSVDFTSGALTPVPVSAFGPSLLAVVRIPPP